MSYNARWYTDEGHLRSLGRGHLNRFLARLAKVVLRDFLDAACCDSVCDDGAVPLNKGLRP